MNIHPTAVVDKSAVIDENAEIGAYSVLNGKVEIGEGTVVREHVTIYGPLKLGKGNIVHAGAILGNVSQDLKYKGEESQVIIGNNNSFRECVTVNQGTAANKGKTIIGDNNFIMAYTHIAHDCFIGNNVIIANGTQLAGHIHINDNAYIGGLVGIHQFVTIGRNSFLGFLSRINRDVPPFLTVEGNPGKERAVNVIGLKRKNYSTEDITLLKKAFMILFMVGKTLKENSQILRSGEFASNQYVQELLEFCEARAKGKNGRALEAMRH